MRKLVASLVAIVGTLAAVAGPALAQQAPTAAIIVIDFARVTRESLAGMDIANQLKSNTVKLQARAQELQDQLRKEEENLQKQQELLKDQPDVFQNMIRDFQGKRQQAENEIQQKNQARQAALAQANAELENALRPIVRQLMTEKKANLALDKNVVFDQLDGVDVTTPVIERLNQRLPSLKVALPE